MVAELIVAGDLNGDLLRTGGVAVAMLGFRTSLHTFSVTESVFIAFYFIILEGKSFSQQGQWPLFTVTTVNDGPFKFFLTTLSTMSVTCR